MPGGTIVCVGIPDVQARPSLPGPELVRDEKIVTGSLYGSSRPSIDIPSILRQYVAGNLPLDRMITKAYKLDELNDAFADMREGKLKRGVVVFDEQLARVALRHDLVTLAA